jgi:hypothetical protein
MAIEVGHIRGYLDNRIIFDEAVGNEATDWA